MSGGRLPKKIMFGNIEGAVWRGHGEKEKEWIDFVQSDIRAFGIARNRKSTALEFVVVDLHMQRFVLPTEEATVTQPVIDLSNASSARGHTKVNGSHLGDSPLLEVEVWVEAVTEGGWRFMVTWRK